MIASGLSAEQGQESGKNFVYEYHISTRRLLDLTLPPVQGVNEIAGDNAGFSQIRDGDFGGATAYAGTDRATDQQAGHVIVMGAGKHECRSDLPISLPRVGSKSSQTISPRAGT